MRGWIILAVVPAFVLLAAAASGAGDMGSSSDVGGGGSASGTPFVTFTTLTNAPKSGPISTATALVHPPSAAPPESPNPTVATVGPQVPSPSVAGPSAAVPSLGLPSQPATSSSTSLGPAGSAAPDGPTLLPAFDETRSGREAPPVAADGCGEATVRWGPALPLPIDLAPGLLEWTYETHGDECPVTVQGPEPAAVATPVRSQATVTRAPLPPHVATGIVIAGLASTLGALAFILYARLSPQDDLAHPRRAAIFEIVKREPGIETNSIARELGLRPAITVYHVARLARGGHILVRRIGRRTALFPVGRAARVHEVPIALLRRPSLHRMHDLLLQRPGLDQAGIATSLGVHQSQASRVLRQLADVGLVVAEREPGRTRYHARALNAPAPTRPAEGT